MRADAWSVGFGLVGLVVIFGMYASLRYALPVQANNPELLLYGLVGLAPYLFVAYGSGAAPKRSWARFVANSCGIIVCLVGANWLWTTVDDAIHIRTQRDAGQDHGMAGSALLVLFFLPIQCGAALVAAIVGGISHDLNRHR
jgi:hypothetical protein